MSLLLDSDVILTTTNAPTVTLLLGLQQLTSIPPDLANKESNGTDASSVLMSMDDGTQLASISELTVSGSSNSTILDSGTLSKKGMMMGFYVAASVLLGLAA